jgi:hypothetical protein
MEGAFCGLLGQSPPKGGGSMSGPRAVSGHEESSTGGLEASAAPAERVEVGAKSGGGFDETGGERAFAIPSSGPAAETADPEENQWAFFVRHAPQSSSGGDGANIGPVRRLPL